ncbi:flagellar biosynthesis protein FlhB [Ideonella sp. DXS22W]|uniref:Flagellar biosynthetic protein FlhB n=1 Tax=Pseudaquabacterium inlustre TaxID=2984192 RepID=A0ABU9CAV1_9BURK
MADDQNRQLPASERKIRKAREEGQVARSRDLAHLVVVGAGGALLVVLMPHLGQRLSAVLRSGLSFDARLLSHEGAMLDRLAELGWVWLQMLAVLGVLAVGLALAGSVAAGGWNFTFKPLAPNFGKLNPISGLGQIVSGRRLADLGKACLLALVVGVIGAAYVWLRLPVFRDALGMPLLPAITHTADTLVSGLMLLVIALAVSAAIDVPLQRFMLMRQLRMSHQEAKQEHKENEGNPEVKGRIRQRMREMSRKRMLAAVPTADLVVMNPTHYAVALKYEDGQMAAPRVVAKGTDLLAFKIRDIAREHKVPVLQAPPLARALYAHTEVDQEVPQRLFTAVAQVLAYVYRLRNALAGRGPMPPDLGAIEVPADMDPLYAAAAEPT